MNCGPAEPPTEGSCTKLAFGGTRPMVKSKAKVLIWPFALAQPWHTQGTERDGKM